MKGIVLFIFCITFSLESVAVNKCIKSEIISLNDTVVGNINQRKASIEKVLNGGTGDSTLTWNVFGYDFAFTETDKYIKNLEFINESSKGIAPEYGFLVNCLEELKLSEKLKSFEALSVEYNNLKIELLKKNKLLNNAIKANIDSSSSIPSLANEVNEELIELEKSKGEIEKTLAQNESKTLDENKSKELNFYKSTLLKFRLEILKAKELYNRNLQLKIEYFNIKTLKLANLSSSSKITDPDVIEQQFLEVQTIWKEVTRQNLYDLIKSVRSFDLPEVPALYRGNANLSKKEIEDLESERTLLLELRRQSITDLTSKKEEELKLLNSLLIQINTLRSNYYSKISLGFLSGRMFTLSYLESLKNEIYSSPYRVLNYLYSKYLYMNEKISLGREGITELSLNIFKYLFLVLALFSFKLVLNKIYDYLENMNRGLIRRRDGSKVFRYLTTIWNKHSDNFYSVAWLIILSFISYLGVLSSISIVLDIFMILVITKIIRSIVILFLSTVSSIDTRSFRTFKVKAEDTAGKFANIYLVYSLIMVFLNLTVGKVYIYTLVKFIAVVYSLYQVIETSSSWSVEFNKYTEKKFSGVIVHKIESLFKILPNKIQAIFSFFFIIILSAIDIFIKATENFSISKKISANLFKKQIESVEVQDGESVKIPQDYKENFSFHSLETDEHYVDHTKEIEASISGEVTEWIDGKSEEHSVVIYGDKGIGKTTLLKKVIKDLEVKNGDELNYLYTKVPAKTIEKDKLYRFIENVLGFEEEGSFDLYKLDKRLTKKTVLVIDEAQNLFLSHTKGFAAYNALLNMINFSTENIFWVLSFNKYSWLYLDRAFGRTQFFRNIFALNGWDDTAIKDLIIKRHKCSEFKLSYDLLINATRSQDEMDRYTTVEAKFFKLIWELSRGNPRAALYLWLTSLSRRNKTTFNVHIPKDSDLDSLDKLADDIFFVIADVLKHENLSPNEIEATTNLPKGIVRNAIKVGQERSFFYKDKHGRYMIEISSQYGLIKYLRSKNFIYGY